MSYPIPGEIVKLDRMAVPSRTKYGIDKLGVGEAIYLPFDGNPNQAGLIRTAIHHAKRDSWAKDKKFRVLVSRPEQRIMVYRHA